MDHIQMRGWCYFKGQHGVEGDCDGALQNWSEICTGQSKADSPSFYTKLGALSVAVTNLVKPYR